MVSFIKLGIFFNFFCKIEPTYPEICSVNVPLQEAIGLYGGLISSVGFLRDLFSVYECFVKIKLIIFSRKELLTSMQFG